MNKIVLIGCGNVGISYAYALLNQNTLVDELILIDTNKEKAIGEALDLSHCKNFSNTKMKIKVGDYKDCENAKLIVITAGKNQEVGESRLDLTTKNSVIIKTIINKINKINFDGIILVATNPLDVMTYLTLKYSHITPNKVIGSGTILDTIRLKYLLSEKLDIDINDIEASVIGEHGESGFIPWSNVYIDSKNITEYLNSKELIEIENEVRASAYEIIKRKGVTSYGIGICLAEITNVILEDKNELLNVSVYDKINEICISTPCIINSEGVKEKINISLTEEEQAKMNKSIEIIKEAIKNIK